jgi:alpha-beta hydrolase superfamily lysophospholipase
MSTFPAADGVPLYERLWPTETAPPLASVVLLHGYGEHIQRYDHVAQALNAAGFAVRGIDLRGHGQSGGARGFCDRFGQYLDDLHLLIGRARQAHPELPLFLVGHSFGGLIVTRYVLERRDSVSGLVCSSPYYKLKLDVPAVKKLAGQVMSKIYGKMALPSGLKGADVCRDPEMSSLYDRDPLNLKNATARWFTESSRTQDEVLARAREIQLPTLFLVGGGDKIADPQRAQEVFGQISSSDKTIHVLEGQYHEVFNETREVRDKTLRLLADWLVRHAAPADGKLRAQGR